VAEMVCSRLQLSEVPQPHDVTDALALALCHANPGRFGEGELPAGLQTLRAAGRTSLPPAVQEAGQARRGR